MTLTFSDVLLGVVLFTCVPLQYFLVQNSGSSESSRSHSIHKFVNTLAKFRDKYLNLELWKIWLIKQLKLEHLLSTVRTDLFPDEGESPAIEVMRYQHKHGYFTFSPEPRYSHPPNVKFHIGQVVMHTKFRYRGVIVGWDEVAKAPPEWLYSAHGEHLKEWKNMPNYSILVDTRDRLSPQLTYVPQVNLDVIQNTQIMHPLLNNHFEQYDGTQYIPRPWLKATYPQDGTQ